MIRFSNTRRRPDGPSKIYPIERDATHSACVIIGAGHVGISVARGLKRQGIEPILIDQNEAIGDSWRKRYDRLHLHHIADYMHLPGVKFPNHVNRYPSRLDLADYLESYAALHDLDVRLRHRVLACKPDADGGWTLDVETPDGQRTFTADQVLLAAGFSGITPVIPSLAGSDDWAGEIVHSMSYINAEPYRGKRVLVVGSGNSAVEILCDLHDHGAKPSMLMRSGNGWVTREGYAYVHHIFTIGSKIVKYIPLIWLAAPLVMRVMDHWLMYDVKRRYGDMAKFGIQTDPKPPMLRMAQSGAKLAPSYIDGTWGDVGVSMVDLIRDGDVPTFSAEISHLEPGTNTVVFKDGKTGEFDTILLCTGFKSVVTHYATFLDSTVMQSIKSEGLKPGTEVPKQPGLWTAQGGLVSARYGLQVVAKRIAAKIKNRKPPAFVLSPVASFFLAGVDPGLIEVPKRTIALNVIAIALIAFAIFS